MILPIYTQDKGAKTLKALSPKTVLVRGMSYMICPYDRRLHLLVVTLRVRREHR